MRASGFGRAGSVAAPGAGPAGARRRPRAVLRGTWVLLVLGVVASSVAGVGTYDSANDRAAAAFRSEAGSISTALVTAIRRDEDFVASQDALFGTFPALTNREYDRWIASLDVGSRYPGGLGFSFVVRVPRARLRAFATALAADPAPGVPTPPPDRFTPFPPGPRAEYCLSRLAYDSGRVVGEQGTIARFDFCAPLGGATSFPQAFAASTAGDSWAIAPPISLYPGVFFVVAPVFPAGRAPASVARRSSAVLGWAFGTFSARGTLEAALGSLHGVALRLTFVPDRGRPVVLGSAGATQSSGRFTADMPGGAGGLLRATVVGGPASGASGEALLVGLLVLALAAALFVTVRLLARSRERALELVDERTSELRHQALHDSLTGLPNRALVVDRAEQLLARARREPLALAVLFVDLDNFKDINDSFGHQRGDRLLRGVAERLAGVVRPSDSVGRLGGDEFVVLVAGSSLDAGPEVVAQRVLDVLAEPFVLEGLETVPLTVRASVGVAVGPRESADELLRDADVALYQAKRSGKGEFVLFHPEMQLAVMDRLALEIDLRAALAAGEIYVEYQPTFDLQTLALTGVEALARWRHPQRGQVPPDEFIPVAEASGMIAELGRAVLGESCSQAARWRAEGIDVVLSVNVSGRQLDDDRLAGDVERALLASGLEPGRLTLELTESVLMRDAASTAARLRELKRLGVRIAIDDFGTGYSSLAYLQQFPVDALKIDRSFIAGIARGPEARALAHTLVQLGKTLGLDTFAEGIEDEAQLVELQRERCDHGQGFYYSRPLPPDETSALLRRERVRREVPSER